MKKLLFALMAAMLFTQIKCGNNKKEKEGTLSNPPITAPVTASSSSLSSSSDSVLLGTYKGKEIFSNVTYPTNTVGSFIELDDSKTKLYINSERFLVHFEDLTKEEKKTVAHLTAKINEAKKTLAGAVRSSTHKVNMTGIPTTILKEQAEKDITLNVHLTSAQRLVVKAKKP